MSSAIKNLEKSVAKNGVVSKFHSIEVNDPRLFIDEEYNRETKQTNLAKILSEGWDDKQAGVLLLNLRPDGKLAVVDGQHRLTAARSEGVTEVSCRLIALTGTIPEIVKQEAQLYTSLNKNRSANTQTELWKAESLFKPDVIEMNAVLAEFGLSVKHGRNKKAGIGALSCPIALHKIHALGGIPLLRNTCHVITTCWPNDRESRDGKVIQGIAHFLHAHRYLVDIKQALKSLSKVSILELLQKMSGIQATQSWSPPKSMSFAVLEIYNKGLGKASKLSTEQYLTQ